jgi:tetratricopeptide (TPR) repeat protein
MTRVKVFRKQALCSSVLVVLVFPLLALVLFASSLTHGQSTSANFGDLIARASAARDQNDIPQAIALYTQAEQLKPEWPDGWWFLGNMQYGTNNYPAAIDALNHYLQLMPKAAPAYALRGLCEFEADNYEQSLQDIQQALSLGAANQPRNEEILRYHEAMLLTRTGRFQEALESYKFFAQKGLSNPELLGAIGLAGLRVPMLPKDVAPDKQDLFLTAGDAAYKFMAGGQQSAADAFQNLFQHFPTAANTHYLYGYLLFPTNPDQALLEFKRELEISPSNASANEMLAWSALTQNDAATALPYAQKALQLDPTLPGAQLVLGRSLTETGNLKDGIERLETALQTDPNNLEIHIALATAYSRDGRKDDSRRERLWCLQAADGRTNQIAQP